MDILEIIRTLPASLAVPMIVAYFYNQLVLRTLDERNEWLAERKAWMELLKGMVDRYERQGDEVVAALHDGAAQDHALRGKVQELLLGLDQRLRAVELLLVERKEDA